MAIERAPNGSVGTQADFKRYRPPKDQVARYYIARPGRQETLETVARATNINVKQLLAFNFPGTVVRGNIVPPVVNWYLHHHVEFNCPETRDRKNRVFQGNEKLAIPLQTTYIEFNEPTVIVGRVSKPSDLWLGVGEAHSGDLVAFGYFNWNARLYRLGATHEGEIEWVKLMSHGFKLGGGLGGSGGLVAVFAHGIDSASQFGSAFAWGDMDFDLALGRGPGFCP